MWILGTTRLTFTRQKQKVFWIRTKKRRGGTRGGGKEGRIKPKTKGKGKMGLLITSTRRGGGGVTEGKK